MTQILLAATAAFLLAGDETERDAVLLECCHLPDKNLTLTEADLDGIAARFAGNVPVKLQHTDTALDPFGLVKSVQRVGKQLLGKLSFAPNIAALVRERGALALSCGLDRNPLSLSEVSLVIKGRLPAATLLSGFTEQDAADLAQLRADNVRLLAVGNAQRVDAQIVTLKLAGKIVPATEAAARVLLGVDAVTKVTLADGSSLAVSEAFTAYLAAQPPLITLGQLTQLANTMGNSSMDQQSIHATDEVILTPDQREFYERALGVNPDDVQKTMTADKRKAANGTGSHSVGMGSFSGMMGGNKSAQERGA